MNTDLDSMRIAFAKWLLVCASKFIPKKRILCYDKDVRWMTSLLKGYQQKT